MVSNDERREHARARLQARQGRSHEPSTPERNLYSAYDETFGALRKVESFDGAGSLDATSDSGGHGDSTSARKEVRHSSVGGRRSARRSDAPMVRNVRNSAGDGRTRGVVVGRESRGGWTDSAYHSQKRGLKGLVGRVLSLIKAVFGAVAGLFIGIFGLVSCLPLGKLIVPFGLLAILVFAGVKFVPGMLQGNDEPASQPAGIVSPDGATPDLSALVGLMGEDDGTALYMLSRFDVDRYWIASHPDSYAGFGEHLQLKMLKLAKDEWMASDFVRNMIDSYPAEVADEYDGFGSGSLSGYPILYQWDERWGCLPYSGSSIGLSGCGPTSMSIVYQGLTGNTDMPPNAMAEFARNNGYMTDSDGSDLLLITEGGVALGLAPGEIDLAVDNLIWTLESEVPVIANVSPGDFSEGGHFIVLVGLDSEGKVLVIDPYSRVNTMKAWDAEDIVSQSKHLVACYG